MLVSVHQSDDVRDGLAIPEQNDATAAREGPSQKNVHREHVGTLGTTEQTTLVLEGLGGDRFKVDSTCFDREKACTAGEAALIRAKVRGMGRT